LIRTARLNDVAAIRDLINSYAELERMLFRSPADLYESLRDFLVFEDKGQILGCCALQIIWSDLAEIKSLAVRSDSQNRGIGADLVRSAIAEARQLNLPRIFTLTLEEGFFAKLGFEKVSKETLPMKVWSDCLRCPKQDHCDEIAMTLNLV